jgi:ubiquinone/menaquinone biosynthesis C-methylase UbiE
LSTDYTFIYERRAAEYDRMVAAEDCDGNLIRALNAIAPLEGAEVLEVGAGTGRITRQIVGAASRVVAVDRSQAMLDVARRHLEATGRVNWELRCADAVELPVASGWADVAVAGWVFGHSRYWHPESWRETIASAIGEMERALRPGGALIIIETLGTGAEEPRPPSAELAEYYGWLEGDRGFSMRSISTDYRFHDAEEAASAMGFFFGDDFAGEIRRRGWARVPEHTGLWFKRVSSG